MRMTPRESVFDEIDFERMAQDAQWGGAAHDDGHTATEWVALLTRHLGLAVDDGTGAADERLRKQLVRVAALAVAAIEAQDRRTGKHIAY